MFSRAQEPKELWFVEGAAHVDLYEAAPKDYAKHLLAFLDRRLH